jgi:multiple sugar transport system ATP-binding protein
MASVSLRGIRKRYDASVEVIKGVDLDVDDGEFMVFVGPSGCGKSSLIRMIAGLEDITEGELHIGGQLANDLPAAERGVAMVFQSYALYPHMTVAENMGFSLKMAGLPRAQIDAQVARAAETLQITALLGRKPKALSGGQRQRVAIGRAIVRKPGVFLFDEPLSNLDAGLRMQMRVELIRLHRELGSTAIYVTHDQTEAMTMGDRIAVFNGGVVEQVGTPMALYQAPATRFVATFLGSPRMNILLAQVDRQGPQDLLRVPGLPELPLALPAGLDPQLLDSTAEAGVRPDAWCVVATGGWPLTVALVERLGDTTLLHLRANAAAISLCLKLPADITVHAVGDVLRLTPAPGGLHLFDARGQRLATV